MFEDEIPIGKATDLRGKVFGRLTVLYRVKNHKGRACWKCRCECGNICEVIGKSLQNGDTKSCGCLQKEKAAEKNSYNLIGQKFGKLTVIEKTNKRSQRSVVWRCLCDCGNETEVSSAVLISNNTKSCGCLLFRDLTNQRFGRLTVIEKTDKRSSGKNIIWKCLCDCGNETEVIETNLQNGQTKSCGCLKSWGEQQITQYLQENNINYKKEYTFNDLISSKGGKLKFDFAILDKDNNLKYLIEYQGIQHYKDLGYFGKFEREETDQLKKEYCKNNNIPLYEIKYDDDVEEELNKILKITTSFDEIKTALQQAIELTSVNHCAGCEWEFDGNSMECVECHKKILNAGFENDDI